MSSLSNLIELQMLETQIEEMKKSAAMARSATLNAFLDLQVMVEEGDDVGVRAMLEELT